MNALLRREQLIVRFQTTAACLAPACDAGFGLREDMLDPMPAPEQPID